MAKVNLIGGTAYLKVNGQQYSARGNFSYNEGVPERTTVYDGLQPAGYTEAPREPMIEGEISVTADVNVRDLIENDDNTVTLELENGKVVVLRNAWYAGEGTVNVNEGMMPVKFVGKSCEVS